MSERQDALIWPGLPNQIVIEHGPEGPRVSVVNRISDPDSLLPTGTVFVLKLKPVRMGEHAELWVRRVGVVYASVWEIDTEAYRPEVGPPDAD